MLTDIFAQTGAQQPSAIVSLLPFILIMVIIWFFMIRPQSKRQKETQAMLTALKARDRVETIGGIIGEVDSIKDDNIVILKIGKDTKIEVRKSAIAKLAEKK